MAALPEERPRRIGLGLIVMAVAYLLALGSRAGIGVLMKMAVG